MSYNFEILQQQQFSLKVALKRSLVNDYPVNVALTILGYRRGERAPLSCTGWKPSRCEGLWLAIGGGEQSGVCASL